MDLDIAAVFAVVIIVLAAVAFLAWKRMGGRRVPEVLRPGKTLPEFSAFDEKGNRLNSRDLRGRAAVILFVRGNWCPFCSRQVADLTRHYQDINERGARLILVTPKPLETTRRVAEFFEFDFEFWLDERLEIARQLGLMLERGVPSDRRQEYGEDTLWPAAVVADENGVVRYATVSKFVADRPDPQKFVRILDTL